MLIKPDCSITPSEEHPDDLDRLKAALSDQAHKEDPFTLGPHRISSLVSLFLRMVLGELCEGCTIHTAAELELLKIREAAKYAGVTVLSMKTMIEQGELPCVTRGNRRRVSLPAAHALYRKTHPLPAQAAREPVVEPGLSTPASTPMTTPAPAPARTEAPGKVVGLAEAARQLKVQRPRLEQLIAEGRFTTHPLGARSGIKATDLHAYATQPKEDYTPSEARQAMGLRHDQVEALTTRGILKTFQTPEGCRRFTAESVQNYINHPIPPEPAPAPAQPPVPAINNPVPLGLAAKELSLHRSDVIQLTIEGRLPFVTRRGTILIDGAALWDYKVQKRTDYTISEAARHLGYTRDAVMNMVAKGTLTATGEKFHLRIPADALSKRASQSVPDDGAADFETEF